MVFDGGGEKDAHARERLATDMIGWMSTVTPAGQPQTYPIWFPWEDGGALVYSDVRAKRSANIAANPRVSLHLADDGTGGDIVIVEGLTSVDPATPPVGEHAGYIAKHGDWITEHPGSADRMAAVYNVPIRIRPVRGRASGS